MPDEFQVTPYQLRHGGVVAREIGFHESADEVRAAMAGGEQPWDRTRFATWSRAIWS
ncbi:hypothetical protein AB0M48_14150 [Lentzea sp. NPDC051208]|uniref:hypothetical protein n=1 Tax=Lentzea sp. NPDC051208 TaxID=3154642 RepID=UPI00343C2E33